MCLKVYYEIAFKSIKLINLAFEHVCILICKGILFVIVSTGGDIVDESEVDYPAFPLSLTNWIDR